MMVWVHFKYTLRIMFKYTEIVLLEYTYMSKKISFKFMFKYILLYLSKKSLVYILNLAHEINIFSNNNDWL